jgi:hypothetical protein
VKGGVLFECAELLRDVERYVEEHRA